MQISRVIHQPIGSQDETHVTIPKDAKGAIDKIQHPLRVKNTLEKTENRDPWGETEKKDNRRKENRPLLRVQEGC